MKATIRKFENVHILLWLLKDLCWVMNYRSAGVVMIIPTVAMAVCITILSRHSVSELIHNLAVVCWICANATWMVGEFFYNDTTRPVAAVFFIAGLLIIGGYYCLLIYRKLKKSA